ncbi:MAG TPA: rRNA maturation RNase YbeY [Puia sp.]|nr:rRNA maturation RNase YbeY [Puia sp.]
MTISPTIGFHFVKKISLRNRRLIKDTLKKLFRSEKSPLAELQYIFVSDERLLEINRRFLGHDYYTDIVTFPLSEPGQPIVGEIYISVDRVRENAGTFKTPVHKELLRVMFHGALHLCSHADKTNREQEKMRRLEDKYLRLHHLHLRAHVSRET